MLQKTDLFTARRDGYHNYRVPSLLATDTGVVLATVEARRGHGGDWDENDLVLRRSVDGGQSWEPPRVLVANADYGPGPVNNCVLIWDRELQAIHLLVCHDYARVFAMISHDGGQTFSLLQEITHAFEPLRKVYPWRVIGIGPGHGLHLRNGRLLFSLWLSTGEGGEFGPGKLGHRPSAVVSAYSDDHGQSWQTGDIVAQDGAGYNNPSETVAVELSDGRVLFNIRHEGESHRRLVAVSPDGATRWSKPVPDMALLEPVCMGSIIGYAPVPGTVLFANPDTLERKLVRRLNAPNCDRKQLTVKLSRDDGRTWPVAKVLELGPSGYSDLGLLPDGTLLCLYENGMVDHMNDPAAVTIARFDLAWLQSPTP